MNTKQTGKHSRRQFLKTSAATAAVLGFPTIVPSSVFGQYAPSKRINVGAIGVGRISRGHDMPGILQYDNARIIAVCDLDAHRVEEGKKLVNDFYGKKTGKPYDGVTGYANYHELLANKDIDAVVVSTPDHWHALIAIDAVRAGKDVYLQKPASLTIAEGRAHEQCRAGLRPHPPDRQPAALHRAIPLRRRTGPQRPHRRACSASKSACPAILPEATRRQCPYPTGSTTTCGSAKPLASTTPSIACIRRRATAAPDGCAAASLAPA